MVPVLNDADCKSFAEIEKAITDFAIRVKNATLKLDDLQGGGFTVTKSTGAWCVTCNMTQ